MGLLKTAVYGALILGMGVGTYQYTKYLVEKPLQEMRENNRKMIEEMQKTAQRGMPKVLPADSLSADSLSTRNVEYLVVNTTNIDRTYAIKSEEEGVVDLQRLVTQSQYEEAWVYVPAEKKWIEVGQQEYNSRKGNVRTQSVEFDAPTMNMLIAQYDKIVFYHIHPYTLLDLKKDQEEGIHGLTMVPKPKVLERIAQNVNGGQGVFPSAHDLAEMVTRSRDFYRHHPTGDISFKIVSSFGVTEYEVTDKGHELFSLNLATIQQLMNVQITLTNTFVRRISNGGRHTPSFTWTLKQIAQTCQDMNTSHYTVRFTPFEQEPIQEKMKIKKRQKK